MTMSFIKPPICFFDLNKDQICIAYFLNNITTMTIKRGMIFLLIVLALHSQPVQDIPEKPSIFSHTVYAYWNNDISLAPTFAQLCINAMRKTANLSHWKFVLLNSENIDSYLSEESKQQMKFILSHKPQITAVAYSDLVRIFVLRDNGGMWIDATSFFVQDLSWIENIGRQKGIKNNFSQQPDMVMFSFNQYFGGNRTIVYDERISKDVVLFPGVESWCIIAKPRCKFINDWVDSIISMYQKGTEEAFLQQNLKQGYRYRSEGSLYFIFVNLQFQTLLQKKQREIQANPSAFKERYAVEYYKLWNFNALQTSFMLFDKSEWISQLSIQKLFHSSLEQIRSNENDSVYFLKFIGPLSHDTTAYIDSLYVARCTDAIDPLPQNSIINQFLFKQNEETDLVKNLRDLERRKRQGEDIDCHIFGPKIKNMFKVSLFVCLLNFTLAIFLAYRCLVKVNYDKTSVEDKS